MKQKAIVLSGGYLGKTNGKTANGLLAGSERFDITAVIDSGGSYGDKVQRKSFGGIDQELPVFNSPIDAVKKLKNKPQACIVGVATAGGMLTPDLIDELRLAIECGLDIVSGLHESVQEHVTLGPLAKKNKVKVFDIRKPKPMNQLRHWTGEITHYDVPGLAILGTDCAIGKRTTAKMLLEESRKQKIKAEMIYTGQTGWMQGFQFGFILDSTPNDFVSGELEKSILECMNQKEPDLIFIEGQSALTNPSGPCGSELICSTGIKGVILQHAPGREFFELGDQIKVPLLSIEDEIKLIKMYGAEVIAVTLNSSECDDINREKDRLKKQLNLPIFCPRKESLAPLVNIAQSFIERHRKGGAR